MSVMQNEISNENIFDMWLEYLWLDGWDRDDPEIYREAARRTESEWLEMN